jgi:hypothetical protein
MRHHSDCDGFRTEHRVSIVSAGAGMYRAVCEDCGALHAGAYGRTYSANDVWRMYADHPREIPCDGRCRQWED